MFWIPWESKQENTYLYHESLIAVIPQRFSKSNLAAFATSNTNFTLADGSPLVKQQQHYIEQRGE